MGDIENGMTLERATELCREVILAGNTIKVNIIPCGDKIHEQIWELVPKDPSEQLVIADKMCGEIRTLYRKEKRLKVIYNDRINLTFMVV
jgi:hypothetical protein